MSGVFGRALCFSAATALLAGCGGPQLPVRASGAMPQASALAAGTHDTENYKVIYSFRGTPDAQNPGGSLIDVGGRLYGTTNLGGGTYYGYRNGFGTVFTITPSGTERVLHNFGADGDGSNPEAGLINVSGTLYGTTSVGGANLCPYHFSGAYYGCGTVFSITPSGTEKVLYSFGAGRDGNFPVASVIEVNGSLYGTTAHGGPHKKCGLGCGTVFSIASSGAETVLHSFGRKTDGAYPSAL
jgi:uncharacterized repeat protein (TIGR03803 family)